MLVSPDRVEKELSGLSCIGGSSASLESEIERLFECVFAVSDRSTSIYGCGGTKAHAVTIKKILKTRQVKN